MTETDGEAPIGAVTEGQWAAVWAAAGKLPSPDGPRLRLMLSLAWRVGARIGEIVEMRHEDFDLKSGSMWGRKEAERSGVRRWVAMPEETCEAAKAFFAAIGRRDGARVAGMTVQSAERRLRELAASAGAPELTWMRVRAAGRERDRLDRSISDEQFSARYPGLPRERLDAASAAATKEAKRLANKLRYASEKAREDRALLRLDKGDLARMDASARAAGLSRSAFVKLHMLPAADALAPRMRAIDMRLRSRGQSLETFLGKAIDEALAERPPAKAPVAADEFDALFRASSQP